MTQAEQGTQRFDRRGPATAPPAPTTAVEEEATTRPIGRRKALADTRARQRERFGGTKPGAAFFGWLVAVGMTVLLAGVLGAAAAAMGLSLDVMAGADAAPAGVTSAAVVLAVLLIAYFTGGYVAGRLARFDGARNGALSWLIGLLVTVLAVVAAVVADVRYDLLGSLALPAVPLSTDQLTVAGIIGLGAVALGTLLAALLGGRTGERFHRRVERATLVE